MILFNSMEDLKHSLLYTTLELQQTRAAVHEELKKRDEQLLILKDLLNKTIRERDEANDKCQRLLLEKLLLQQHNNNGAAPVSGISSIEDDHRRNNNNNNINTTSSDCEESIVSSPVIEHHLSATESAMIEAVTPTGPLPEKGKLLQAVMKAGPLLQTLLLAGPLPQWRHPPPPLESFEIPPVTIPSPPLLHQDANNNNNSRKREFCDASESSPIETKYQRVALH
ncbi:uncharacterized protein LOC130945035 [Arachis stenosperma]|uniref:uncharacterized protein LOC130945035 n=1 Tax=Arachis stenosperma TaxID=217475 RepID=UPI0025ABDE3C|nr:uncharacterized protein LOC130945035 [Arachis stenosperma]